MFWKSQRADNLGMHVSEQAAFSSKADAALEIAGKARQDH
jgi:hypothetical protein